MPLSDLQIRKAKQKDKSYRMSDGLGLFLLVRPTRSKAWQFRYQYMGKEKLLSLGAYPAISLADARRKRDEAKAQLANDIDPSVQKQLDKIDAATRARMTFKEVADEYLQSLVDRELSEATLEKKRWFIDEADFGELLRRLDAYTGWPVITAAMKFQILTCTRPGETRGAQKKEFDLENRTWTVPPERMKMRREHKVPLSSQALQIIEENWSQFDHVELIFPSLISTRKRLSENAFNTVLRRIGYSGEEVTAHGFRATASTILNEREYNPDVIEATLAHQDPNAIRRTYNRTTYWDQRVELMQVWADLCDGFRRPSRQ